MDRTTITPPQAGTQTPVRTALVRQHRTSKAENAEPGRRLEAGWVFDPEDAQSAGAPPRQSDLRMTPEIIGSRQFDQAGRNRVLDEVPIRKQGDPPAGRLAIARFLIFGRGPPAVRDRRRVWETAGMTFPLSRRDRVPHPQTATERVGCQ